MVRFASGVLLVMGAVGCGVKKPPAKQPVTTAPAKSVPRAETEADREHKRHQAALALVPEGTTCFPAAFRGGEVALTLAAVESDAVVCGVDRSAANLGVVACWKVDLSDGSLTYQAPAPLAGHGFRATLDADTLCTRGFCLPKDTPVNGDRTVEIAWSPERTKAVIVAQNDAHVFDANAHRHEVAFSLRGDKGLTGNATSVHWVGNTIVIGGGETFTAFKADGTPQGPLTSIGAKPEPLKSTTLLVLDQARVGVPEHGFSQITTFEVETGKRAKIVRKTVTAPCKPKEVDAYWKSEAVGAKCKTQLDGQFAHLVGADAVAGKTNFLVLLRGPRLGELAVLDAKNLSEKKTIKLPWCEGDGEAAEAAPAAKAPAKPATRAPAKKKEDPDGGGE